MRFISTKGGERRQRKENINRNALHQHKRRRKKAEKRKYLTDWNRHYDREPACVIANICPDEPAEADHEGREYVHPEAKNVPRPATNLWKILDRNHSRNHTGQRGEAVREESGRLREAQRSNLVAVNRRKPPGICHPHEKDDEPDFHQDNVLLQQHEALEVFTQPLPRLEWLSAPFGQRFEDAPPHKDQNPTAKHGQSSPYWRVVR